MSESATPTPTPEQKDLLERVLDAVKDAPDEVWSAVSAFAKAHGHDVPARGPRSDE